MSAEQYETVTGINKEMEKFIYHTNNLASPLNFLSILLQSLILERHAISDRLLIRKFIKLNKTENKYLLTLSRIYL